LIEDSNSLTQMDRKGLTTRSIPARSGARPISQSRRKPGPTL